MSKSILATVLLSAIAQTSASEVQPPVDSGSAPWEITAPGGWHRSAPWNRACTLTFHYFSREDDLPSWTRLLIASWKGGEVDIEFSTTDWNVADGEEGQLLLFFDPDLGGKVTVDIALEAKGGSNIIGNSTRSYVRGSIQEGEQFLSRLQTTTDLVLSFQHGSGRIDSLGLPQVAEGVAKLRRCSEERSGTKLIR